MITVVRGFIVAVYINCVILVVVYINCVVYMYPYLHVSLLHIYTIKHNQV